MKTRRYFILQLWFVHSHKFILLFSSGNICGDLSAFIQSYCCHNDCRHVITDWCMTETADWKAITPVVLLLASYGFLNLDGNIYLQKGKNNWSLLQSSASRSLPQISLMLSKFHNVICSNNLYDLHVVTTSFLWLNWQRLVWFLRSHDAISAVCHKLMPCRKKG